VALYTVIYDACVLYPAPLRDLLMQFATAKLFRARWTTEIHEEWMRNLLEQRKDLKRERIERTRDLMNDAVPDCLVEGYEYLIPTITLPDKNDRHIVAAAIQARADAIVTSNLKHFPADALSTHNLEAIHPDDFITSQIDLDRAAVLSAVQRCHKRLQNPPRTAHEYLATLEAQGLPKTVAALRPYASIL
jgi:predicted nucleic acid-binding protein